MIRHAPNLLRSTLGIFVLLSLTACASAPRVLVEYETVEKIVAVKIPIPETLLVHPAICFFPMTGKLYIFDLDEWHGCAVDALIYYYIQIEAIKAIQENGSMSPAGTPEVSPDSG